MDVHLLEQILERVLDLDLRRYARKKQGMVILREEGLIKCVQGITSPAEIISKTDRYED